MKIHISTSTTQALAVGMRVAYCEGRNEWYTGTISKLRGHKVTVEFDDGNVYVYDDPSTTVLRVIKSTRKSKLSYTTREVKDMAAATTTTTARPKVAVVVPAKIDRKVLTVELGKLQMEWRNLSMEFKKKEDAKKAAGIDTSGKPKWKRPYYDKFAVYNKQITELHSKLKAA